jgi:hypothetical protein
MKAVPACTSVSRVSFCVLSCSLIDGRCSHGLEVAGMDSLQMKHNGQMQSMYSRRPAHVCSATFEKRKQRAPVHRQRVSTNNVKPPKLSSTPSLDADELGCSHFPECSGCHLATSVFDPPVVTQAREFFSSRGYDGFTTVPGPVHGWRCRARLAVRGKPGAPVIGLFKRGTHEAVAIPDCRQVTQAVDPGADPAALWRRRGCQCCDLRDSRVKFEFQGAMSLAMKMPLLKPASC